MNYKIEQGGLWELGGEIMAIFDAGRGRAREERSCRAWRFVALAEVQKFAKKIQLHLQPQLLQLQLRLQLLLQIQIQLQLQLGGLQHLLNWKN